LSRRSERDLIARDGLRREPPREGARHARGLADEVARPEGQAQDEATALDDAQHELHELAEGGDLGAAELVRAARLAGGPMTAAWATSSTHTGWKRVFAPTSGTTGPRAAMAAKRLKNWSSAPKTTEGRRIIAWGISLNTAASPAALERP
jgi:hypothetical protein